MSNLRKFQHDGPETRYNAHERYTCAAPFSLRFGSFSNTRIVTAKAGRFPISDGRIICESLAGESRQEVTAPKRLIVTKSNSAKDPVSFVTDPESIWALAIEAVEKFRAYLLDAGDQAEHIAAVIKSIKAICLGIRDSYGEITVLNAPSDLTAIVFSPDTRIPTMSGIIDLTAVDLQLSDFGFNTSDVMGYNKQYSQLPVSPTVLLGRRGILAFE